MKKHLVLLFGLLLAFLFVMPSVVAATDIEFGPPDFVVGQVNVDDVLMDITAPAEHKGALSFDTYQLQSCSGHHDRVFGPHTLIGFNSNALAMCGHLGGVHSSPFG